MDGPANPHQVTTPIGKRLLPGLEEAVGALIRYRYLAVVVAAMLVGWATASGGDLAHQDPTLFARAGDRLFSREWIDVFGDPQIQVGPLHLLIFGCIARLSRITHIDFPVLLGVTIVAGFSVALMGVTRSVLRQEKHDVAGYELVAGLAGLVLGLGWTAFAFGQPSDGLIVLLWILAARYARQERPVPAGCLLGVAIALKLWGVLGLPIVLVGPWDRRALLAGTIGISLGAFFYAPFLIFGEVRTFEFRWLISPDSPWRWLYGTTTDVPWTIRLLEGALVIALGAAVALAGRRLRGSVWTVPLAIASAKLLLDPEFWPWYLLAVSTATVIGACWLLAQRAPLWMRLVLVAVGLSVILLPESQWLAGISLAFAASALALEKRGVLSSA